MIAGTVPEDGKMWISENPYIALHESRTWLCHNFDGNVDREKLAIWSPFFFKKWLISISANDDSNESIQNDIFITFY